ncbi:MAG: T9SS type A sorting domain-containing protein [Bacteroidota bacterium]|nr:T9SS type A sorting domain-containing protein [Bacteroidota bacterium]
MKRMILSLAFGLGSISTFAQVQKVTVSTGAGYANEVFYSMANGVVKSEPVNNWHLAFTTNMMSASIRINENLGLELYKVATDTASYFNLDTTSKLVTPLYNQEWSWEEGALNANATGHPDYGWGIYNQVTHGVTGDVTFVLKIDPTTYKKFFVRRMAADGSFVVRISNLDGSSESIFNFNKTNYSSKLFVYYDVLLDQLVDREPAKSSWDLTFTRYSTTVQSTQYPVSGILQNPAVNVAEIRGVDTTMASAEIDDFSDTTDVIGWDFKNFNMASFQWEVSDSLTYYVEGQDGNIYRMVFTGFEGTSTGNYFFNQSQVSTVGLNEATWVKDLFVYPNPAKENLHIRVTEVNGLSAELFTLTGQAVRRLELSQGENTMITSDLAQGIYILRITEGRNIFTQRIIKQ